MYFVFVCSMIIFEKFIIRVGIVPTKDHTMKNAIKIR